jgi:hypothetical protein
MSTVSLTDWVGENKALSALIVACVILVILWLTCRAKSGFGIATTNPNPWNNWGYASDINRTMGGLHAGAYGSMWLPNTPPNNMPFDELQRIARYGSQQFNNLPPGAAAVAPVSGDENPIPSLPPSKEGFTSHQLAAAYSAPDQLAQLKYLSQGPCGYTDAGAAIEVQALTSMGCYATYPYAVAEFQNMVDQTDSIDSGLTPAVRSYQDATTQGL